MTIYPKHIHSSIPVIFELIDPFAEEVVHTNGKASVLLDLISISVNNQFQLYNLNLLQRLLSALNC